MVPSEKRAHIMMLATGGPACVSRSSVVKGQRIKAARTPHTNIHDHASCRLEKIFSHVVNLMMRSMKTKHLSCWWGLVTFVSMEQVCGLCSCIPARSKLTTCYRVWIHHECTYAASEQQNRSPGFANSLHASNSRGQNGYCGSAPPRRPYEQND